MKIVLVGYMGSGKSTVGKELALTLKCDFLDLDAYIEAEEGLTIQEIFAQKGELYFRKKEGEYLRQILESNEQFVLATGGGTPCYGANMKVMLAATKNVFYLKLSLASLVKRLTQEKEERPLIKDLADEELLEFIGKHLFERSYFYNQAKTTIDSDDKTPKELAETIEMHLV